MKLHHETIKIDRIFPVDTSKVFAAYTDIKVREQWSAPDKTTEIRITESDIRTGGFETGKCGTKGEDLNWLMKVAYHRVEEDRLINFTEELWDGDNLLTVALITFDIESAPDGGTILRLTDHVTSFVGEGGAQGHRDGYSIALDNLLALLSPNDEFTKKISQGR